MGIVAIVLGYLFWWLLKSGHPSTKSWRVRNFFGRLVFFTSFPVAGVAVGREIGPALVLMPLVWLVWIFVIAIPATLIYYFWKVRKT